MIQTGSGTAMSRHVSPDPTAPPRNTRTYGTGHLISFFTASNSRESIIKFVKNNKSMYNSYYMFHPLSRRYHHECRFIFPRALHWIYGNSINIYYRKNQIGNLSDDDEEFRICFDITKRCLSPFSFVFRIV